MDSDSKSGPIIGITVELLDQPHYEGKRRFQLFTDYLPCVRGAGGVPLLLPTDAPPEDVAAWLDHLDGLLLTGGDDPDLRRHGGEAPNESCRPIPEEQQQTNQSLVAGAVALELPILGVCLGMQMMGLAHDAPYIQDLAGAEGHTKGVEHPVTSVPGSRLCSLVGAESFAVASYHHQALAGPGDHLTPVAFSEDGTLEAVELQTHPFFLGIQWHPERLPASVASQAIFSGFVAAAREYREGRK